MRATGALVHELHGHTKYIYSLAMTPDGSQLASVGAGELRFWDLATGQPMPGLPISADRWIRWSPDAKLIVTDTNGSEQVTLWDAVTGRQVAQLREGTAPVFSPTGDLVAFVTDARTNIRVWNVQMRTEVDLFKGHSGWIFQGLAFSSDGRRLVSTGRGLQAPKSGVSMPPQNSRPSPERISSQTEERVAVAQAHAWPPS